MIRCSLTVTLLRRFFLAHILIMALSLSAAAEQDKIQLVVDGGSDYVIVRPENSSASQVYAASELQYFIKEMTGAELAIKTDNTPLPSNAILLGWTRHTGKVTGKFRLEALGDDGFTIRSKGSLIAIVGGPVRGTLYGVYELLEKYGGCRWYTKDHSIVPKRKDWILPAFDDTQRPAFAMREPFWWPMFPGDLAARNKANGNRMNLEEKHGGKVRFGKSMFVHTFEGLLSPHKYFEEHPDYFSEVNGKRTGHRSQLCLTNPDVLGIVTANVMKNIREDPTAKLFSVSQNDWDNHCACNECLAVDTREGSPSGTMIQFVNKVAQAVEKEFPQVWIETLAYQYTRHPPKTIKPRHNVVPRLCSIECDFSLPLDVSTFPQNVKFVEDIKGWAAITDKLYVWDYTTNFAHYVGPHPNFNCLQGNVKFFRDHKVVGLFEQGNYQSPHGEFAELRAWVLAKLLWNPDQDINALYDDFFNGYYGPATKPIRTYFDELQSLAIAPEHALKIWSSPQSAWYSDEFFERSAALWDEAERLAVNEPNYSYHVRMGALPVMYARLFRWKKQTPDFRFTNGIYKAEGLDNDYVALASEFLKRIEEGKVTSIAENSKRHQSFITTLKTHTAGLVPTELRANNLKASVVAELGGRVTSLAFEGTPNYLNPNWGGIEFVDYSSSAKETDDTVYRNVASQAATIRLDSVQTRPLKFTKNVTTTEKSLKVSVSIRNETGAARIMRPLMRTALDLGDSKSLFILTGTGPWLHLPASADRNRSGTSLDLTESKRPRLTIASARTGRSIRLEYDKPVTRIFVELDVPSDTFRVHTYFAPEKVAAQQSGVYGGTVTPLAPINDLPPYPKRSDRVARVVQIEDCLIPLHRPGEWGEMVADDEANDGFALKLFNTHYEWCVQWQVDPGRFEPGKRYKLRARIRVDKSERAGEAFWAGIYNYEKKSDVGQIAPTTETVSEKYEWHDIVDWTPESGQYIWIGPGRFEKDGGRSAIEAVYVDRLEMSVIE